nr:hypothetical protein [Pseudomonas benzenivorans]
MAQEARKRGHLTLVLFALLVVGEIIVAIKSSSYESNPLKASLLYFMIAGIPLLFVFASIYIGTNLLFPIFLGWVCIVIGLSSQYAYHTSHDPSRVMVLAVSLAAYWVCGILALFSVSYQDPN